MPRSLLAQKYIVVVVEDAHIQALQQCTGKKTYDANGFHFNEQALKCASGVYTQKKNADKESKNDALDNVIRRLGMRSTYVLMY